MQPDGNANGKGRGRGRGRGGWDVVYTLGDVSWGLKAMRGEWEEGGWRMYAGRYWSSH